MPKPDCIIVPLDARPVCYDQVCDLASIGKIEIAIPPKNILGFLKQPASFEHLWAWWIDALNRSQDTSVIMSLDTITYGGLIASRVNNEAYEILKERSSCFLDEIKILKGSKYGFSSILRIPNYDNEEEEPPYWLQYGRMLYRFSEETHRYGSMPDSMFNKIPAYVIKDFLGRREKNFNINQTFVESLKKHLLDFLVFCQDDTGPYGLNVREADVLQKLARKERLENQIVVQTGADELAMLLLAKQAWQKQNAPIKIYPWFFPEHGKKIMANFDGMPIGNIVQRHMKTLRAITALSPQSADLILMINCPSHQMGDHCIQADPKREKSYLADLVKALKTWLPEKNVAIADVVYANGADPLLIESCISENLPFDRIAGYAAWNTPGNTIGSSLAIGSMVTWAMWNNRLDDIARRKLLFKRLLDDWYYQANVRFGLRQRLEGIPDESVLKTEMDRGSDILTKLLHLTDIYPAYSFPCNRLFEIAIEL